MTDSISLKKEFKKGDLPRALQERLQRYQHDESDQISNVLIRRYKGTWVEVPHEFGSV